MFLQMHCDVLGVPVTGNNNNNNNNINNNNYCNNYNNYYFNHKVNQQMDNAPLLGYCCFIVFYFVDYQVQMNIVIVKKQQ